MKRLKKVLAAALSLLTLSICSITAGADKSNERYDALIDPNHPAEITVNDGEVQSKFYYGSYKKILLEFADNVNVSDYDLKGSLEKDINSTTGNSYTCSFDDISYAELKDYAAQLRETDGIITAEPVIISYHATCGLFNSSKETGLTIYIGGGKTLDELKADKELCSYVDSIGGVITTIPNMLDKTKEDICITGIADRKHFREIITKINSFESVNNKARYLIYSLAYLKYKATYIKDMDVNDITEKLFENPIDIKAEDTGKHKGDINNDGKITAADASMAFSAYKKNYTSGKSGLSELELYNADFNGDGKVTAEDASGILSQYKKTYQS